MTPRQRARRRPAMPEFHDGQLLDWSASWHSASVELPCRYCEGLTYLRDSKNAPAHKVCAERALAAQYAQAVAEYREGVL